MLRINYPGALQVHTIFHKVHVTHAITFSSEGVGTKCNVVFRLLLMAIFAFDVNGEYPCQSEFIPLFKLRTRRLNALEVNGITASMKIHR